VRRPAAGTSVGPAPIEYEPGLIEDAVRWAIEHGGDGIESLKLQRLRFGHRRKLDVLYRLPEGDQREAAFRDHFATMFSELGNAEWIPRWLEPFPRLRSELECVVVRAAAGPGEDGAELWESQEQRGEGVPAYLVITVSGTGLRSHDKLGAALLPDLLRAADLLDPDFGFRRGDLQADTRGAEERIRSVYQRLWELSARARLRARGLREDDRLLEDSEELIAGAGVDLGSAGPEPGGGAAGDACRHPVGLLAALCRDISHQQLLGLAHALPAGAGTGASAAPCPLCHYPTTDWAPSDSLGAVESEIHADFPAWSAAEGCCGHCAERYELLSAAR